MATAETARRGPGAETAQQPVSASLWSRRDFFGRLGWMGFGLISLVSLLAAVRSRLRHPDGFERKIPIHHALLGHDPPLILFLSSQLVAGAPMGVPSRDRPAAS